MINRSQLRSTLRQQRLALSHDIAIQSAHALTQRVIEHPAFINSTSIAAYLSYQNEIDPIHIMHTAWEQKKTVYIPTLHPHQPKQLQFVRWMPDMPLTMNRYGILEPIREIGDERATLPAEEFDLVLLPLVGFDADCNRLGTGAGYYDRTFAFLQTQKRPTKPQLMGLGYEFQRIDNLMVKSWDIPLDAVITDKNMYISHHEDMHNL